MNKIFFLEIVANSILVGIIWTIQLINYPSFNLIGKENYQSFHRNHVKAITPLVAPLMIIELVLCLVNFYFHFYSTTTALILLSLIGIVWGTTFFLSIPIHEKLILDKDEQLIQKLVRTNWVRTICWSLKLIFLLSTYLST
jgi:hypothetical protein